MNSKLSQGFAVPFAALAIALLALGLVLSLPVNEQLTRELRHAKTRVELERAAMSAESRVAFLLLTQPIGIYGPEIGGVRLAADGTVKSGRTGSTIERMILDGRPYRFQFDKSTEVIVRAQEESGLMHFENTSSELIARLLRACGVPQTESRPLALQMMRAEQTAAKGRPMQRQDMASNGGWRSFLKGDLQRRLNTTISGVSSTTGMHEATAPRAVLMALHKGNQRKADEIFGARGKQIKTTEMAINYYQFASSDSELPQFNKIMTGNIRLSVEIRRTSLTMNLPFYYYQSSMQMDRDNPLNAFNAESPIFNAGNAPKCYQPLEEFVGELPKVMEN